MSEQHPHDALSFDAGREELAALDHLADELRAAYPDPELSGSFHERLDLRLAGSWTLRSAMDRNPLLRAAAGLLVVCMVGAPVAALVGLFPGWSGKRPDLGFEAPQLPPEVESVAVEPDAQVVPPEGGDEVVFSPEWRRAMERTNRMALAGASWADTAGAPQGASGEAPAWSTADADQLWEEFLRRCARGDAHPPESGLEARVLELAAEGDANPRLGAWLWVLDGEQRAGVPGWLGAPFLAE